MTATNSARAQNTIDQSAIDAPIRRFIDGWNRHEARAVALAFVEDADFTNVVGTHVHGRGEIEKFLAPLFAGRLKESYLAGQIRSLRFLQPDLAVIDIDWEMNGQTTANGIPGRPIKGLMDWVLRKTQGHWLIIMMHNAKISD